MDSELTFDDCGTGSQYILSIQMDVWKRQIFAQNLFPTLKKNLQNSNTNIGLKGMVIQNFTLSHLLYFGHLF